MRAACEPTPGGAWIRAKQRRAPAPARLETRADRHTREHTYRPAAQLAAEDAAAGAPWSTTPPEAMPVLTETREDDGAGWTSKRRRNLREGWYDPARGEFRGFAELRDETTSPSAPATTSPSSAAGRAPTRGRGVEIHAEVGEDHRRRRGR